MKVVLNAESSKMQNNLREQIDWLVNNLSESHLCGFQYAPTASKKFVKPDKFSFDNQKRVNSRNVALSTVGDLGHLDLQIFRNEDLNNENDDMNGQIPPNTIPEKVVGVSHNTYQPQVQNKVVSRSDTGASSHYSIPDSAFLDFDLDGESSTILVFGLFRCVVR